MARFDDYLEYDDLDVDVHGRPVKMAGGPKSFDDGFCGNAKFKGKGKTRARRSRRNQKESFLYEG